MTDRKPSLLEQIVTETREEMKQESADLELALRAMAYLIHDEWGHGPVSEIVGTYGDYGDRDREKALQRLEADPRYAFLLGSE